MTVPGATYPYGLGGQLTSTGVTVTMNTTGPVAVSSGTFAGPYTSVTSSVVQQAQPIPPANPKRGHRECRECYWWDKDKNMNGEVGYCWHKVPGMSYGNPAVMSGHDWCSFYEPAKQTILSPKWQELMKEKKVL